MFERVVTRCPSRQALLRHLTFQPVLPAYSKKAYARFERRADRRRNDEAFSVAMVKLFAALKPLDEVERAAPLRFSLAAPYSPTDPAYRDPRPWASGYDPSLEVKGDLSDSRYEHSYLHINKSSKFPFLDKIFRFYAASSGRRYMAPGPIFSLLENMPLVDDLHLNLYDNEKKKPGLRKQLRVDFGEALSSTRCAHLKELTLEYLFEEPCDHRFTGSDMRVAYRNAMRDPFSLDLRILISTCPTLVRVSLSGPICVDESLFWSPEFCADGGHWLNLKYFHVDMSPFRPDGGWYLDEHPGFTRDEPCRQIGKETDSDSEHDSIYSEATSLDGADDDDDAPADENCRRRRHWEALREGEAYILYFRSESTEALERVWKAAARAAAIMPKLCVLGVGVSANQCPRTEMELQEFGFAYGAANHGDGDDSAGVPQLDWTAPRGRRMSEDLQALWRRVLGPEGEVKYEYW